MERLASREPELEEPATQETRQEDGETASGNAEETSSQPASGTDEDARDEPATEPQRHVYGSGISVQDLMVSDDDDGGSDRPRNEGDPTHGDEGEGSDDEDDDMSADEEELEAILADEEDGLYPSEGTENSPFSTTPIVHPRRLYRGARNVETVKDVTFLGAEKNFIGSGSDDGNFFVWSKEGKLEGIWEGDSAVVNVIEQHPSLPLCAVSGIDSTVKVGSCCPIQTAVDACIALCAVTQATSGVVQTHPKCREHYSRQHAVGPPERTRRSHGASQLVCEVFGGERRSRAGRGWR